MTLYGEQVIPLSKVVKELCLKQNNLKETAIFQQLVYGRWAWKELFRKNIWGIKNVVLTVDKNNRITLPDDCERLINISVIDCLGKLQPLTCDASLSTVVMDCIKPKCTCTSCNGSDTLCGAVESVAYTTETVEIQGEEYTLETWTRYDGNGAIQKQEKIPTLNASTNEVVYTTNISTICSVEVTDKGCIKATASNMELLRTYCGCGNFPDETCGVAYNWLWRSHDLIPQPYNYFGYYNFNAQDRSIVHIFRHENALKNCHDNNPICKVVVSYQTNGEASGEEILIPQFAQFAIDMGIMWQQKLYNPRAGNADKEYAEQKWNGARVKINKLLNPIRLDVVAKLQTQERRW